MKALTESIDEVFQEYPGYVQKAQEKPVLANWIVGQVMKRRGGNANVVELRRLVGERLWPAGRALLNKEGGNG